MKMRSKTTRRGDVVKAVVLDVDVEKERISLGIKQLGGDPVAQAAESGAISQERCRGLVKCWK